MPNSTMNQAKDHAYQLSKNIEGEKLNFYDDGKHVPTISIGVAGIVKNPSNDPSWSVKTDMSNDLVAVGAPKLGPEETNALKTIANELNQKQNVSTINQAMNTLSGYSVTEAQSRALFDTEFARHFEQTKNYVGEAAFNKLEPKQQSALAMMTYQSPRSVYNAAKDIANAIQNGDIEAVAQRMETIGEALRDPSRAQPLAAIMRDPTLTGKGMVSLADNGLGIFAARHGVSLKSLLDQNPAYKQNPNAVRAGTVMDLPENAIQSKDVYQAYAKQGINALEADKHWLDQAKNGNVSAATQGMTVQESRAYDAVQKGAAPTTLGLSGNMLVSAIRMRDALSRGDSLEFAQKAALESRAEMRNYTGPSTENSPEDSQTAAQNQAQLDRNTQIKQQRETTLAKVTNLLDSTLNLSVPSAPFNAKNITITDIPKKATMTAGTLNVSSSKKHRNKGFETGLIGLGMSPENAKNSIAATQPELNMTTPQHFEASLARMNRILSGRPVSQKAKPNQVTTPAPADFNIGMVIDRNITARMMAQRAKNTLSAEDKAFAEEATRGFYGNTYKDNVPGPVREGAWQEPSRAAAIRDATTQAAWASVAEREKQATKARQKQNQQDQVTAQKQAAIESTQMTANAAREEAPPSPEAMQAEAPKQETLGQESFLGGKEKGLQSEGLGRSLNDPSQTEKSIAHAVAQIAQYKAAKREAEKNMSWRDKSWSTMTSQERGRSVRNNRTSLRGAARSKNAVSTVSGQQDVHGNVAGVNPGQVNKARNIDGTYSVDKDGNGAGNAGGTVICTELYHQDLLPLDVYMADQRYGLHLERTDPYVIAGYHFWAKPIVRLMQCSKTFTHVLHKSLAEPWAKEMVIKDGGNGIGTVRGKILFTLGLPVCRLIGRMLEFVADKDRSVHSCSQREQEN